jgi:hypothetical protein
MTLMQAVLVAHAHDSSRRGRYSCYLLLVAMSPLLHVEGSRTRLGAVVVGRCCSVWYILVSTVAFHLWVGNCSFSKAF